YQRFLVTGRTQADWDWYARGAVLFLGGDQGFTCWIARRLGYPLVVYAEWQVRYSRWMDRVGLRTAQVYPQYQQQPEKFRLVGDLNIDGVMSRGPSPLAAGTWVGLLPGSKGLKLGLGGPLLMAVAEQLQAKHPVQFVLPVAPTLSLAQLAHYVSPANPNVALMGGITARLEERTDGPVLVTTHGTQVRLWTEFPAYDALAGCRFCLTTVGVNTAELAALGVPMVVLIPLNKIEVMKAWDGLPGLVMNLPVLGNFIARRVNPWLIRRTGLLAWPNLLAGRAIVPELKQVLTVADVVQASLPFLTDDDLHRTTRTQLLATMGGQGAAQKLVGLVKEVLGYSRDDTGFR
ncbi:hypothetical protein, partial [Candidatus Cyanaurora vandensis]